MFLLILGLYPLYKVLLSGGFFSRFCSALNPDSSICTICRYSPWFFSKFGLRFVEYAIFNNEYLITDPVIIIDASFVFALAITICQ
jgi:hypothetical protein